MRLGLSWDQLWAGANGRDVPSDSARLVQLESVILLNNEEVHKGTRHNIGKGK